MTRKSITAWLRGSRASLNPLIVLEKFRGCHGEGSFNLAFASGGRSYYSGNSTDWMVEVEDHLIVQKGF
jgi:hypothetical protein